MRLVEEGKLDLDTPVWSIVNQYSAYDGKWGDSRLFSTTVRQMSTTPPAGTTTKADMIRQKPSRHSVPAFAVSVWLTQAYDRS